MKFTRTLTSCTIAIFVLGGITTTADEGSEKGIEFLDHLGWFKASSPIQDLRERSTETFELLDENDSGSITLEEIDLAQFETDMANMNPAELQQNRKRASAIRNKFMSWSEEINEFEVVDSNEDGYWSEEEFEARVQTLNLHRLELGIKRWDKDENGAVELHEFTSHLDELELLDEDGDGTVSRDEAFKSKDSQVISDVLRESMNMDGTKSIFIGDSTGILETLPDVQGDVHVEVIHTEVIKKEKEKD